MKERVIKCPYCGFEGSSREFYYMYEAVLYYTPLHNIEKEDRERPVLVICPRCKQGFFLESPYKKVVEFIKKQEKE